MLGDQPTRSRRVSLFRRLQRGDLVCARSITGDEVTRIVKRRALLAGLSGDWAACSLRSGFVTEAGRQGVPLGEVMAMTEHRSVGTVMGHFQAGEMLSSRASDLLKVVDPLSKEDRGVRTRAKPSRWYAFTGRIH